MSSSLFERKNIPAPNSSLLVCYATFFYSYMPLYVYHIYLYVDLKLYLAHQNHDFIGITAENKLK